ncbi:MAG: outer membrane protein assembly factor BamE [Hyphomonadaceae bacterium]
MARSRLAAPILMGLAVSLATTAGGCAATRDFHGYVPDQALPTDVKPEVDTRATVQARLGSPSTTSIFNNNLWVYTNDTREELAFYYPRVVQREIVAIQFDENDVVSDVLVYDVTAGRTIEYNSRVTPTRGRELSIIEQLFGSIGRLPSQLPGQQRREPGQ